jgi:hypothetical protein
LPDLQGFHSQMAKVELQDAVSTGVSYGMQYQEIYQKDILNPALANIISTAAEMLTP